jgi:hypothetical protein
MPNRKETDRLEQKQHRSLSRLSRTSISGLNTILSLPTVDANNESSKANEAGNTNSPFLASLHRHIIERAARLECH